MLKNLLLGNLSLEAIPYHDPIIMTAVGFMVLVTIAVLATITMMNKWKYIMCEWVATVDHKKIGIMYLMLAGVMLLRGFSDAVLMRSQQAISVGENLGFLPPEHFAEIFSAHGTIMIFFVAMPFMFGLMNLVLPLQIGARDVAYPFLNNFSFWMTFVGAMLINVSLAIGKFATAGWLSYPPLAGIDYSPGVGVDYYVWGLQIAGVGTTLGGVNFVATILKMRCPGMTLMKMPVFVWTTLCSMILVCVSFPVLTVALALLELDRMMGMHFFTQYAGGNMMMYVNLIWAWGHPEVYILILPAFGIFSEVVATFSQKKLFGYTTMVYAVAVITVLAFSVWVHHFFTMGGGGNVNAVFGIATMIISIPTGVKVFNWLFTMYKGKIILSQPMLWVSAFFSTFVIGGVTGVMLAIPPVDFQFHNTLFLVAHFHNVIIGGVLFGYFAGFIFWFPKVFGFKLEEGRWGLYSFACWVFGFYIAFMPLYFLGLLGVMRRTYHFANVAVQPYFVLAAVGTGFIFIGVLCQLTQIFVSIKNRKELRDRTGDPWNGRTLEWSISSPAPFYNFAVTPKVSNLDQHWINKAGQKVLKADPSKLKYEDIHMPKDTFMGFIIAMFAGIFGFAMVWHMVIPAIIGFVGMIATFIVKSFNLDVDYYVKAAEVKKIETAHYKEATA